MNLIRRIMLLAFGVLALVAGSSCSAYRVEESEILLRYFPAEDVLLLLEVEYGVHAQGDASEAAHALDSAVNGRRRYPSAGGLITLDLDKPLDEAEQANWTEQQRADYVDFGTALRVVEAHVFADSEGRLSFVRLTRIHHAQRVLEIIDAYVNRTEAFAAREGELFVPEYPIFDETTREAIRSASAAGHKWLHTEGDAIVLDVPMTRQNAARCVSWIKESGRDPDHKDALQLVDRATSLEVTDGHARLRFGEEPRRVTSFVFKGDKPGPDARIREHLRDLKVPIEDAKILAAVREKLDGPPAQIRSK